MSGEKGDAKRAFNNAARNTPPPSPSTKKVPDMIKKEKPAPHLTPNNATSKKVNRSHFDQQWNKELKKHQQKTERLAQKFNRHAQNRGRKHSRGLGRE